MFWLTDFIIEFDKKNSRFLYCSIFGFLLFVISTNSFYKEEALMFRWEANEELYFLQTTYYTYSALNTVMMYNCLKFWLLPVFIL